ncbi:MAG: class I SAM-dependent methyltransferase [Pseudomonadota bacterium]
MHLDVLDLKAFYYRTTLGRWVQAALQRRVKEMWTGTRGCRVEGFGFAAPLLRPFMGESELLLNFMPAEQGVMRWPADGANRSVLVEETAWPIEAGSVDRLIVAHGLETCERPAALLEEMYRVVAPEGRIIVIVPNRLGSWARRDATPFGYGRPYSQGQLDRQLREHGFDPVSHHGALYAPPHYGRKSLRMANWVERAAHRIDPQRFAGVLVVEAMKRLYPPPTKLAERARNPLGLFGDISTPVPAQPAGVRGFGVEKGLQRDP